MGKKSSLLRVSGRQHSADDIIATVLAVEPMRFVYRGRICVFSVNVLRDERIVIVAEQKAGCSEEVGSSRAKKDKLKYKISPLSFPCTFELHVWNFSYPHNPGRQKSTMNIENACVKKKSDELKSDSKIRQSCNDEKERL